MRIPMQFQALENSVLMETYEFLKLGKFVLAYKAIRKSLGPNICIFLLRYLTYLPQWISNLIKTIKESNTISHYELSKARVANSI